VIGEAGLMMSKIAAVFSFQERHGAIFLELKADLGKDIIFNLQLFSAKSSGKNKTPSELSTKKRQNKFMAT
jgi:hypothetical protein